MATRTTPINSARVQECIVRDVLFDDGEIKQFMLRPGQLIIDILRERGDQRDFIEFPAGTQRINC